MRGALRRSTAMGTDGACATQVSLCANALARVDPKLGVIPPMGAPLAEKLPRPLFKARKLRVSIVF
jgi:hypothetical protein